MVYQWKNTLANTKLQGLQELAWKLYDPIIENLRLAGMYGFSLGGLRVKHLEAQRVRSRILFQLDPSFCHA